MDLEERIISQFSWTPDNILTAKKVLACFVMWCLPIDFNRKKELMKKLEMK